MISFKSNNNAITENSVNGNTIALGAITVDSNSTFLIN
jgi:hypothetical protein